MGRSYILAQRMKRPWIAEPLSGYALQAFMQEAGRQQRLTIRHAARTPPMLTGGGDNSDSDKTFPLLRTRHKVLFFYHVPIAGVKLCEKITTGGRTIIG